ncbi:MAG: cold shock domain-containing protein [Chloroflexi bacterium]|nr:cold shock domain-containing protein [Chloroflexota bacterium]
MATKGTVARMIRDRGFGFIRDDQGEELFFHASAVQNASFDALAEGQQVEFEKTRDPRGRGYRAENVRLVAG